MLSAPHTPQADETAVTVSPRRGSAAAGGPVSASVTVLYPCRPGGRSAQ